jgi:hypothetical protein
MIWRIAAAATVALIAATAANAAPDTRAVSETIRTALAKANAGDANGFLALCLPAGSVIDEFAPFHWDTFSSWGSAFGPYFAQNNITRSKTKIIKFNHVNIDSGRAYAVATVSYTFRENGKPRKEPGTEVYALEKSDAGWRIASFAWFGKSGVDGGADATAVMGAINSFASMSAPPAILPTAIVDEFPPFHWTGSDANAGWFAGLQKSNTESGVSDLALHLSRPSQLSINGDRAYATVPTVITDTHHGKPESEHGAFAFALDKSEGAWHIASWAWATQ